jgi:hypothetical protein
MLHCLFGFPFGGERVKCPECKGNPKYGVSPLLLDPPHNRDKPCKTCQGTGTIPAPLIRDVWRTDTVIGLAREIAGGWTANQEVRFMNRPALLSVNKPPDYSRCPILAEALALEAGCDDELVLEHLRGTAHCGECTVLKELTR